MAVLLSLLTGYKLLETKTHSTECIASVEELDHLYLLQAAPYPHFDKNSAVEYERERFMEILEEKLSLLQDELKLCNLELDQIKERMQFVEEKKEEKI